MCGICGIVNLNEGPPADLELLKNMVWTLSHRGPDSSGVYRDRSAALGHSRLAIIDLDTGSQPLSNEDETLWISFNGEIYNYPELNEELKAKGHRFKTKSDTETILHAWEEWGPDSLSKFNGQWAFAIWDVRRQNLVLCRDRHGIRPLYYTKIQNRLVFASEIKALFCDNMVSRAFDPQGLGEIFTLWSPIPPRTAWQGISEIPPGHYISVQNGEINLYSYWNHSFPEDTPPSSGDSKKESRELIEQFSSTLINAVRLRFSRSDVPVGVFLSGGIDSSVIAAIISGYTDTCLSTFSIRFQSQDYDEGHYQNEMVRWLGSEHHELFVSDIQIRDVFPEVVRHTERPVTRTAPAPFFLLSKLVHTAGYKTVVTGEGADEVLAGYDIFKEAKIRRLIAQNPDSTEIEPLLRGLYSWMERGPAQIPAFSRAFFKKDLDLNDPFLSHRPRWNSITQLWRIFSPEYQDYMKKTSALSKLEQLLPQDYMKWAPLHRDQWLEYTTLLPGYILSAQGDRMLMAHSVESRYPFLDHRVTEFADRLPPEMKLNQFEEKYILKQAFGHSIPPAILNRPKQPYRAPDSGRIFFSGKQPEWVKELLSEKMIKEARVFQPETVSALVKKFKAQSGTPISNSDDIAITGILSTMLCYNRFIKTVDTYRRDSSNLIPVINRV